MIHAQVFGRLSGTAVFHDGDDERDAVLAFRVAAKPDAYRMTKSATIHCRVYGSRAVRWRDRFLDGRRCVLSGTLDLRRGDSAHNHERYFSMRVDTLEFIFDDREDALRRGFEDDHAV
jgi:hypothetical protein